MEELIRYIRNYAAENRRMYTLFSLDRVEEYYRQDPETFRRCLLACRLMIDLHVPVDAQEEDELLSALLCHGLADARLIGMSSDENIEAFYPASDRIRELVRLVVARKYLSDEKLKNYYDSILADRDAFLIKLAERSNFSANLHGLSIWDARKYVQQTRAYYFPLCIKAKEQYPELYGIISVLMEKMRSLTDVADILSGRYQEREIALTREVLDLREENARIRGLISSLENSRA